jgi:hypothetical protein
MLKPDTVNPGKVDVTQLLAKERDHGDRVSKQMSWRCSFSCQHTQERGTKVLIILGDLCGFYRACSIPGFPEELSACSETMICWDVASPDRKFRLLEKCSCYSFNVGFHWGGEGNAHNTGFWCIEVKQDLNLMSATLYPQPYKVRYR